MMEPISSMNRIMENGLLMTNDTLTHQDLSKFNITQENTINSIWEENYQDLTDWCLDTLHSPCVFHIGESQAMIHSGIKTQDMMLSTDIVGDIIQNSITDDKSTIIMVEEMSQNSSHQQTTTLLNDNKKVDIGGELNIPDAWLDKPNSSIAVETEEWVKLIDNENEYESLQQIANTDTSNFPTVDNRQEDWDAITTDSNSFNLLSYLSDNNIQLSESTSMEYLGDISQNETSTQSTEQKSKMNTRLRNRQRIKIDNISSTSSTDANPKNIKPNNELFSSSRRRRQTVTVKKPIEIAPIAIREKKRTYVSDSDDQLSNSSYKECREKNNEASRKSRMNKKVKEKEMQSVADELERDNRILKMKVEQLDKMVTAMRAAILKSALNKSH